MVTYYLEESGVIPYLETLGFGVVGYCIIALFKHISKVLCTKQYWLAYLEKDHMPTATGMVA